MTDEQLENSPDLPSSSNSNDSSEATDKLPALNSTSNKVIMENHAAVAAVGSNGTSFPALYTKNTKSNNLDAELSESSSNQSLPVISIKDTETNLPSCMYDRILFCCHRVIGGYRR